MAAEALRILQSVIDALPGFVAAVDERGVVLAAGASWRRYAPSAAFPDGRAGVGMNYLDLRRAAGCREHDAAALKDLAALLSGEGGDFSHDYSARPPDGRRFRLRGARLGPEAAPVRALLIHEDVTEAWEAERERDRAAAALEHAVEGVGFLDAEGRYVYVNARYAAMVGRPAEELVGASWEITVVPEELDRVRRVYDRMLSYGRGTMETRGLRKDGGVFHKEITLAKASDADGRHIGHYCFAWDITARREAEEEVRRARAELEQRVQVRTEDLERANRRLQAEVDRVAQAERALRESEARLRLIADAFPSQIAYVDAEERYLFNNRAYRDWFGIEPDRIRGMSVSGLLGEDAYQVVRPLIRLALSGETVAFEEQVPYRTGARFVSGLYVPDLDERGRTRGLCVLVRDETERRRLIERLQEAEKFESLGVLAGGVAHDFNNLLMAILGNADLASHELEDGSPLHEHLGEIERAAERAAELTARMLAYAGKALIAPEPLDPAAEAAEVVRLSQPNLPRRVRIETELAPAPPVEADRHQFRQALSHLLANAWEAFGADEGVVTVRVGIEEADRDRLSRARLGHKLAPGAYAFTEVCDSGPGMTEAVLARCFEPFFSTKFLGRGLGLSAVLGIARAHKGAIVVESAPGRGSKVRILWPVCAPRANPS